jgi:hypothetical protein
VSTAVASLNALAEPLVDHAWSVAWQWTLLVLLVALPAQWLLRNHSPALRYWIWQIVLLKLLLMPCWTRVLPVTWLPAETPPPIELFPGPLRNLPPADPVTVDEPPRPIVSGVAAPGIVEPAQVAGPPAPPLTWQAGLLLAWGGLFLVQFGQLARQHRRLARLLRLSRPADDELRAAVRDAARALRLGDPPRVLVTDEAISPFVCGALRPVLVLPAGLTASLTPVQLRQVLFHELAHIRRRDLGWGWIPQGVRMLWCVHPVVHWVTYRLRLERELACDQLAMYLTGHDAAAYARTLVEVVTQTSRLALPGSMLTAVCPRASTAAQEPAS